ncbi:MAG: diguanylate cyclase [Frankiaceae bacterium]|nr:diguanylate cyclase [Frankiaceae bacterium]
MSLLRWLLILAVTGYAATTIPGVRSHTGYNVLIDGWLHNATLVGASLLIFLRAYLVREDRAAWVLVASGIGFFAMGTISLVSWVQYIVPAPYPSVADVGWLAFYPLLYVGLVVAARRAVTMSSRNVWLDSVIGVLGVSAFAALGLQVVLDHTSGGLAALITTIAYPIGDLILLLLVVGTYGLMGWRPGRVWTYLGIGVMFFAVADTVYLILIATNTYTAGTPLDPMWSVACSMIALAAMRKPPERAKPLRRQGWVVLFVPSLCTFTSLCLLVYASTRPVPVLCVVLATATMVVAAIRSASTFREVQGMAAVRQEARTDELTGLGNRRQFHDAVRAQIDSLALGERCAVMILDLDRFKEVNDALGHPMGDQLLVEVGQRLAGHVRGRDVLARLGGDEFALMLELSTAVGAYEAAERLRADLLQSFTIDGMTIHIDASVGIAICPDVATTVDGLLQRADIAMYQAKAERCGTVVYQTEADGDLTARLRLVQELRTAIADGQLLLHYQPKVDLRSQRLIGVEALVRWQHPTLGLLFPDSFVAEAERSGLMRPFTTVVLGLALDQVRDWQTAGMLVPMAVNISTSNLLDVELPSQIEAMLDVRGLPAEVLTVEVTESTLMVDAPRALSVLGRLRALGVRVSVDDYGTGYSSLARLRELPVDELKLDRSFITELGSDDRAAAIVDSTVKLAQSLGLPMVAEGIETAAAMKRLTDFGCDIGQGYFIARPAPANELTDWLLPGPAAPRRADRIAIRSASRGSAGSVDGGRGGS